MLSDANIVDCLFTGNESSDDGGAVASDYNTSSFDNRIVIHFEACSFGGNEAITGLSGRGGAIYLKDDVEAIFNNCAFVRNYAKNGGALISISGSATLNNCIINNNQCIGGSGTSTSVDSYDEVLGVVILPDLSDSIDLGGGLVFVTSHAYISNTTFSNNKAGGANGSGGAISFYGSSGNTIQNVNNCLFTDNSSNRYGGAISARHYVSPSITNCTFINNSTNELGGVMYCDLSSKTTIINSILQNSNSHAIVEVNTKDSTIKNCLFNANNDGDFGLYNSVTKEIQTFTGKQLSSTNVIANPQLVEGPLGKFYLSQGAAGQDVNSPAVDAGDRTAVNASLDGYTTRIDGIHDSGIVDIGYHFRDTATLKLYNLTTSVNGIGGTIQPHTGTFYEGSLVTVSAVSDGGYRPEEWTGTIDDTSRAADNFVIMWADRQVTVSFDKSKTYIVGSNPTYATIMRAIDAAEDGDTVILPGRIYNPPESFRYHNN